MPPEITSLLWALAVTVLMLALAYWFTRYVVGRLAGGRLLPRQSRMTVLEQLSVGRDQRLLLVKVGDKVYLLGVTSGGITRLETLTAEEAASWMAEEKASGGPPSMSFREALRNVIKPRNQ